MTAPQPHHQAPNDPAVPALTPGLPTDVGPLTVTHAEMNTAYDTGDAIPLAQSVSWLVRYRKAWWVVYEHGWLKVIDNLTEADLNHAVNRLAQADAVVMLDSADGTED